MKHESRMDEWTFWCHAWAEIGETYRTAYTRRMVNEYHRLGGLQRFA